MKPGLFLAVLLSFLGLSAFAYTSLTIFVIQPLGAIPEGRTLVIWKREKLKFVDSADAVCDREMASVNLFCRMGVLAGLARSEENILARLPYSQTLYLISTGGKQYDR